jgi:chromosomal replication initiator protein
MAINFPQDVKEYIASNCTSDIRKLEGAITRVFAYASIMNGSNITLDLAVDALKDFFVKSIISKNKIDQVQQLVARQYNITVEDLKSKKRSAKIGVPRQIAMYICRTYLNEPLARIGSEFGGKDHTTVMHSVEKITKETEKDTNLADAIQKIIPDINMQKSINKNRPRENGVGGSIGMVTGINVSALKGSEVIELLRRVENGEKIKFK